MGAHISRFLRDVGGMYQSQRPHRYIEDTRFQTRTF